MIDKYLNPVVIIISIANILRECIIEMIQQKNVLTETVDHIFIDKITELIINNDQDWFTLVIKYLKHIVDLKKLNSNVMNIYSLFCMASRNIFITPVPGKSEILFSHINTIKSGSNTSKKWIINERGLFSNYMCSPNKFCDLINNTIKNEPNPTSVVLKLQINSDQIDKWPEGFLKQFEMSESLINIKHELIVCIVCFLNLLLKENLLSITINFFQFHTNNSEYDAKFLTENINSLDLNNLKILSSMCLMGYRSNYTDREILQKSLLLEEYFTDSLLNSIRPEVAEMANKKKKLNYHMDCDCLKSSFEFDEI